MKFNLKNYLKHIALETATPLDVSTTTLFKIVEHQVANIPYQNVNLFLVRQLPKTERTEIFIEHDVFFSNAIANKMGGYCHQLNELLAVALTEVGFVVEQIAVIVTDNQPFDPKKLSTHHILLVRVNDKSFLVDVGFGYNSIRLPLEFDFHTQETQNITIGCDTYRLSVAKDHYSLELIVNQEIFPFYRFARPYKSLAKADLKKLNLQMILHPEPIVHDRVIRLGKLTKKFRMCIHAEPFAAKPIYRFIKFTENGQKEVIEFKKEDFMELARTEFGVCFEDPIRLSAVLSGYDFNTNKNERRD